MIFLAHLVLYVLLQSIEIHSMCVVIPYFLAFLYEPVARNLKRCYGGEKETKNKKVAT